MKKIIILFLFVLGFCQVRAGTEISRKTTFTADLRSAVMGFNKTEGIVGNVQSGGYIRVKLRYVNMNGTVQDRPLYLCQTTRTSVNDEDYVADEILGEQLTYSYNQDGFAYHVKSGKDLLGRLQGIIPERFQGSDQFASVNYPHTLMNTVYSDLWKMALIPSSLYTLRDHQNYYQNVHRFELEVITKDATVKKVAIPGLAIITSFDAGHPCSNVAPGDEVCDCLQSIKTVGQEDQADIIPAAHRGSWGSDDQTGPPENSAAAIRQAKTDHSNLIEVDLMMTKDKQLVCMHDYNLERLTNYGGTAYIFDKNYAEIQNLKLRNRNGTVSNEPILRFNELLDIVKSQHLVLNVDIKEWQARVEEGICVANCDYQTAAKQQESWFEILRLCLAAIQSKDAYKHVIFKTYYSPDLIFPRLEEAQRKKILFAPMLISKNFNNDVQQLCQHVDNWISKGGPLIAYFETDFFNASDIQLASFTRGGRTYLNVLHYLHDKGYRGGIFSEEPVGPKGTVNRWAKWGMKDTDADFRADYVKLMSIPYGNKMVITTDRVDIWKQIIELLK